jgi:hypothetical protein
VSTWDMRRERRKGSEDEQQRGTILRRYELVRSSTAWPPRSPCQRLREEGVSTQMGKTKERKERTLHKPARKGKRRGEGMSFAQVASTTVAEEDGTHSMIKSTSLCLSMSSTFRFVIKNEIS